MGFLDNLLIGGVAALIGSGIRQTYRNAQETKRRKNSKLHFDSRLGPQEFIDIASRIGKRTPRVARIVTNGMTIVLEVRSNSGLSTWTAEIDFNDYGRLTGTYWLTSENTQSPIPGFFANAVQAEIVNRVR